jgi:hypothetical protein
MMKGKMLAIKTVVITYIMLSVCQAGWNGFGPSRSNT